MSNLCINDDMPIISLSVNFDQVNLSINDQNVSALLRSSDFDHNVKSRFEYIRSIFDKAYKEISEEYAKLLAEIYIEVSAEEIAPTSKSMIYYMNGEEEYSNET